MPFSFRCFKAAPIPELPGLGFVIVRQEKLSSWFSKIFWDEERDSTAICTPIRVATEDIRVATEDTGATNLPYFFVPELILRHRAQALSSIRQTIWILNLSMAFFFLVNHNICCYYNNVKVVFSMDE